MITVPGLGTVRLEYEMYVVSKPFNLRQISITVDKDAIAPRPKSGALYESMKSKLSTPSPQNCSLGVDGYGAATITMGEVRQANRSHAILSHYAVRPY